MTTNKLRVKSQLINGFLGCAVVKNLPANVGDLRDVVGPLGWEDPLEEEMATHSSILAWRIPWTEQPGGLVHRATKSQTRLKRLSSSSMKAKW